MWCGRDGESEAHGAEVAGDDALEVEQHAAGLQQLAPVLGRQLGKLAVGHGGTVQVARGGSGGLGPAPVALVWVALAWAEMGWMVLVIQKASGTGQGLVVVGG